VFWTRRRPRLASFRAAAGDRSWIDATSLNGIANTSCRTTATHWAQSIENDQHGEAYRLGEHGLVLWAGLWRRLI
jgi:hypothetical protein